MRAPQESESPAATGLIAEQIASSTHIVDAADAARKTFSSLQAMAALRGIAIEQIQTDDGSRVWLLQRWGLSRQFESLDDLHALLRVMGVQG